LKFNVGDLNDLLVDGEIVVEKKRDKKGKRKETRKKR
jgi:hypothetical protein